jgi:hypothetical protein
MQVLISFLFCDLQWCEDTKKGVRIKINMKWSWDSAAGVAIGYGLGVLVPIGASIFSSPLHPDRLWGPPSLLSNGYRRLFPRRLCGQGDKLITHLQVVPRSRMVELYLHSTIRLHDVVFNYLSTGTKLLPPPFS